MYIPTDGATLPPGLATTDSLDMFISLMCRRVDLQFEQEVSSKSSYLRGTAMNLICYVVVSERYA